VRRRVDEVQAAVRRAVSRDDKDAKNVELLSRKSEALCCCGRQGESSSRTRQILPPPSQCNKVKYLESPTKRRRT